MLYINKMTDRAVELTIAEVGEETAAGGMLQAFYDELKRLKNESERAVEVLGWVVDANVRKGNVRTCGCGIIHKS